MKIVYFNLMMKIKKQNKKFSFHNLLVSNEHFNSSTMEVTQQDLSYCFFFLLHSEANNIYMKH